MVGLASSPTSRFEPLHASFTTLTSSPKGSSSSSVLISAPSPTSRGRSEGMLVTSPVNAASHSPLFSVKSPKSALCHSPMLSATSPKGGSGLSPSLQGTSPKNSSACSSFVQVVLPEFPGGQVHGSSPLFPGSSPKGVSRIPSRVQGSAPEVASNGVHAKVAGLFPSLTSGSVPSAPARRHSIDLGILSPFCSVSQHSGKLLRSGSASPSSFTRMRPRALEDLDEGEFAIAKGAGSTTALSACLGATATPFEGILYGPQSLSTGSNVVCASSKGPQRSPASLRRSSAPPSYAVHYPSSTSRSAAKTCDPPAPAPPATSAFERALAAVPSLPTTAAKVVSAPGVEGSAPVSAVDFLNPLAIRFSQARVNPAFVDGASFDDAVAACTCLPIRFSKPSPGESFEQVLLQAPFPQIEVVAWRPKLRNANGSAMKDPATGAPMLGEERWFTMDNRRLYCLQRAALAMWPRLCYVPVKVLGAVADDRKVLGKFKTTTQGANISVAFAKDEGIMWEWRTELQKQVCDTARLKKTLKVIEAEELRDEPFHARITSLPTSLGGTLAEGSALPARTSTPKAQAALPDGMLSIANALSNGAATGVATQCLRSPKALQSSISVLMPRSPLRGESDGLLRASAVQSPKASWNAAGQGQAFMPTATMDGFASSVGLSMMHQWYGPQANVEDWWQHQAMAANPYWPPPPFYGNPAQFWMPAAHMSGAPPGSFKSGKSKPGPLGAASNGQQRGSKSSARARHVI